MKPLVLSALVALSASAADIPAGEHVLLRMVNSVNTRTAKAGDQVYLQTASPIASGGQILVPVGTYVQGTVQESKRSGRVKGRAEIALHLETLTLANGQAFKIAPHLASTQLDNALTGRETARHGKPAPFDPTKEFYAGGGLTPGEKARLHDLALPGFDFQEEAGRFYPLHRTGAHLIGFASNSLIQSASVPLYTR